MKIVKYIGVAFDSINAHRMRATLTILGIIIGVAAVLMTMGIGSGAAASITESIESTGTNLLTVSSGGSGGMSSGSTLTMADVNTLADSSIFPQIAQVAPQYSSSSTLTVGGSEGSYTVVGTTPNYAAIKNLEVASGEFLTDDQNEANQSVVVLGSTVASDLFGGFDAVGETVRIDQSLFTVTGVLAESGGSGFGSSDSQVFVPLGVAQGRLYNATRYRGNYAVNSISLQVAQGDDLDAAELQVEQVLRLRHSLDADDDNDFTISSQADMLEMVSEVSRTLTALLGGIGAVSLIVGGIGIMNIMLVSVTERTREIGLRKALGAHRSDILLQFLVESLMLCALGGAIGIGISLGLSALLGQLSFMPLNIVIEPWTMTLALTVSTASGFVFGLYPALRATRLDPIDALRYE